MVGSSRMMLEGGWIWDSALVVDSRESTWTQHLGPPAPGSHPSEEPRGVSSNLNSINPLVHPPWILHPQGWNHPTPSMPIFPPALSGKSWIMGREKWDGSENERSWCGMGCPMAPVCTHGCSKGIHQSGTAQLPLPVSAP